MYNFLNLAVLGGAWSAPRLGSLTNEKDRGFVTGLVWSGAEISHLHGFDPLDSPPLAIRYTERATPANDISLILSIKELHQINYLGFSILLYFPPLVLQQPPQWARASSLLRHHDHTQAHHSRWDFSGRAINSSQGPILDNTQRSKERDIFASCRIRTRGHCTCSFWFTYACGDRPWCRLSGNWLRYSACY